MAPQLQHIRSLLIANRGEIALRIARTARRLGVTPGLIYTDADEDAPHRTAGGDDPGTRVESYLDIDAVVAAARQVGADAVHPGYGFLSERAEFARAVESAGLRLVGPSADVIDRMGRKDAARKIAVAAGVPVVPAYDLGADPATFTYPVLVKAAAGGGGKGMRVVRTAEEYGVALAAARREAAAAFGDDTLLVERYVERGRHIEVQVLADGHGTTLHLWERDCSSQRRHQKVIEEAPAPHLPSSVRELLTSSAVALARAVGYVNAGTVEFLVDADSGDAFFLEMNTRLQVEHPVTEAITGLDLVELQLRVADGQPVGLTQAEVRCEGHAIEARLYAEDAFGGFLPQAGTATAVRWPESPPGVRVDHALWSGQHVGTAYDPMLAKVIVHAPDREQARVGLLEALDGTAIFGLTTNAGYLRALVASEEFAAAEIDTAWLDRHQLPTPDEAPARALAGVTLREELDRAPAGPWQPDGFRPGGPPAPLVEDGRDLTVQGWVAVGPADADGVTRVGLLPSGDGHVRRSSAGTEVVHRGQRFVFDRADAFADHGPETGDGTVLAPMPGTVVRVEVAQGDPVAADQVLGMMEAMKMELTLRAPFDGTVSAVDAVPGRQCALGDRLFEVSAPHSPDVMRKEQTDAPSV